MVEESECDFLTTRRMASCDDSSECLANAKYIKDESYDRVLLDGGFQGNFDLGEGHKGESL